jgi:hypothetical protein
MITKNSRVNIEVKNFGSSDPVIPLVNEGEENVSPLQNENRSSFNRKHQLAISPQRASMYIHTMPNRANDDYFDFDDQEEIKDDSFEDLFVEAIHDRNNGFESAPRNLVQ